MRLPRRHKFRPAYGSLWRVLRLPKLNGALSHTA